MNKLLLVAALLCSVAVGTQVAYWDEEYTVELGDNGEWLSMTPSIYVEFGYDTTYDSGIDEMNEDWQYEEFGAYIYTWVTLNFNIEIMSQYHWGGSIIIVPFEFAPYNQVITWYRPNYETTWDDFDMRLSANRHLAIAQVFVEYVEEFKTIKKSFIDYIMDLSGYKPYPTSHADFQYYDQYYQDYDDPQLYFYPIDDYVVPNADYWMDWYGDHEWYGCWMFKHQGGCNEVYY